MGILGLQTDRSALTYRLTDATMIVGMVVIINWEFSLVTVKKTSLIHNIEGI